MQPLRVVFFGTAQLACPPLRALAQHPDYQLAAIVTQPDRPRGRHLHPQPSPVKAAASPLGLPIWQPQRARNAEFLRQLAALEPHLVVVVAYGQLLPASLLQIPTLGCLNVHASLLPQYRGAAPIQWAILNGDAETGVTIMKIDEGLDTGDILTQRITPIHHHDTAETLHDRLATLGAQLLLETLPDYVHGQIQPRPQPAEGSSYARKITKEDGQIDWHRPAQELHRRIRAFTPWPGAFTWLHHPPRPVLVKIWHAQPEPGTHPTPGSILDSTPNGITVACGQGTLRILNLQREGGRRLEAREFVLGHPLPPGTTFSSQPPPPGQNQEARE